MDFLVKDETSKLKSVIIGIAKSSGGIPNLKDLYDPKSIENLISGNYPLEKDMINELENFSNLLIKHGVHVYRPDLIKDCNQIFVRDIGFVIDNFFFKSNILPNRAKEFKGVESILNDFSNKVISLPEDVHIEGGDLLYHDNYIFVGFYNKKDYPKLITARTNSNALEYLRDFFPNKIVKGLQLNKSLNNPFENILHLDCCLQIVGKDKAIIYPEAFTNQEDYNWLVSFFGMDNIFKISNNEMYEMTSNVLSIDYNTVISQPIFKRLNNWLESKGFSVEKVDLSEVSKQEGLFRCSSLPLIRN
ncbi:MAG: arginine deiminase-related protein [Bacteroidetes bacterium]|jgi:N-dimethylarginine dimethylaminohydrolase|nr:MAG: amidinotransferase [Cryomorphaceae bacterium BACL29 MAG-121220-bin8]MDA0757106.1 arginine deiminase-related protein [Bacteroidota bacterium]MDA1018595.1 arginine deiminase-related protein [Bacteroidota bacterium]|tara:strand:- start:125298 stop:126206 length:909 start_codon:yes stop_codon:yes gene_type:complete